MTTVAMQTDGDHAKNQEPLYVVSVLSCQPLPLEWPLGATMTNQFYFEALRSLNGSWVQQGGSLLEGLHALEHFGALQRTFFSGGRAREIGVPCTPTNEPLCEPKLFSPKANCPGAPLGPSHVVRDVFRGVVTCESCCTAGFLTSVRATLKNSPPLDMSWIPAPGNAVA